MPAMALELSIIPALADNYIFALSDSQNNETFVIDPAEAKPVLDFLANNDRKLTGILNTHHHWDHTGGNKELKEKTGCKIYGPSVESAQIPLVDQGLKEGDSLKIGRARMETLDVSGHTRGHLA